MKQIVKKNCTATKKAGESSIKKKSFVLMYLTLHYNIGNVEFFLHRLNLHVIVKQVSCQVETVNVKNTEALVHCCV